MSRSTKKAIIKERPRNTKKTSDYWRRIRRVIKAKVKEILKDPEIEDNLPNPKELVNDYDRCDYTIDYEYGSHNLNFWLNGENLEGNTYAEKAKRK